MITTWGEANYTRSHRLPGRKRRRRHYRPTRPTGYYLQECVPVGVREDTHICDATCRYLAVAQAENVQRSAVGGLVSCNAAGFDPFETPG